MNYPLISEYIEAIKSAEDNFEELCYLRAVLDNNGQPIMTSGNFAVVFKMKDEQTGKMYAVKCFTKEQEGRAESYKLIADELEYVSSNYLTPIKYYENELYVDTRNSDEKEFPVLLMDWIEGKTLDVYIKENAKEKFILEMLTFQFCKLASWLLSQPFAHGDLKPDNILVRDDGSIVLVDYDGMFVPSMKGQCARELGSPGFRHPQRSVESFDEHVDDFSIALIAMSLKAYSIKPELLNEYCNNDSMFFTENDYVHVHSTKAMAAILEIVDNEELCSLFGAFMVVLAKGNLNLVSPQMFTLKNPKTGSNYGEYIYNQARNLCEKTKDKSKIDHNKAFRLFRKAANLGYAEAQCCMGCCYKQGYGTQVDYTEAIDWYVKSSKNKCARALRHIAMCYEYGLGKEKDIFKAIDYYLKAASEGDYYSYVCIGKAYESGTDVKKDLVKAFDYFVKAANNGNAEGQRRVGVCYHAGQGVERDYDKGIFWLEQSANQNDSLAQKVLGYCYFNGDGVRQDYVKAMYWYKLSAENGNEVSQYRLGLAYLAGIGVEKDSSKALMWIEKAAKAGSSEGLWRLGHCYENGIGAPMDLSLAKSFYEQAAQQGSKKAQEALTRMENDDLYF